MRGSRYAKQVAMLLVAASVAACSEPVAPTRDTGDITFAKGGPGRTTAGPDVVRGDLPAGEADAPALESTCPAAPTSGSSGWAVVFGNSGCLIVDIQPPFWVGSTAPYRLTDDLLINVRQEKGKNGRITHVRLAGQDVEGPDGIWHDTDWVAVAEPVVPTTTGFTLHVHALNLAVWRTDSHLAGGNRVEIIGHVSIGDVVYSRR